MENKSNMSSSEKLLALFAKFADRSEPWTVDELSRELELAQSTTYRHVKALTDAGLLVAVTAGSYILGPTIIMLDRQMRLSDPLILSSETTVDELFHTLNIPGEILICRLFRDNVMCVDSRRIGEPQISVSYVRGRPLPLYRGAASKAILAHIPLRTVKGYFDAEPENFVGAGMGSDWTSVKRYLRDIRRTGLSVTQGELDKDVIGYASPIIDDNSQPIGSLGFVSPKGEIDAERNQRLSRMLLEGAARICEEIRKRSH